MMFLPASSESVIEIDFHDDVINSVYRPLIDDDTPTQILFGGGGSGKSHFVAQRAILDMMGRDRNYLVMRKVNRTLRGSAYAEMKSVIDEWGLNGLFDCLLDPLEITCTATQRQAVFVGLDDAEKLKSVRPRVGAFTDKWYEEATELTEAEYDNTSLRARGGDASVVKRDIFSFNPIHFGHWLRKRFLSSYNFEPKVLRTPELLICHTTHWDNAWLTPQDHANIEAKTGFFHDVYARGRWGVLGKVIFTNWRVEDLREKKEQYRDRIRYGLDFGFSDDPAACAECAYVPKENRVYVFDELYERGLTNQKLARKVKPIAGDNVVWCESAEPKSIAELRNEVPEEYRIRAHAVKKTKRYNLISKEKSSVLFRIQWLQEREIVVDSRCINMQNELSTYQWQTDRNGDAIAQPVDANNHLIDALGYGLERDMLSRGAGITTIRDIEEETEESEAEDVA